MQKNTIELAGFLGAKPTVRFLPSGTKVVNVRLAEGYRYAGSHNQEQEHTNWHTIVFYGRLADVAEQFDKGDNVLVEGSLQIREFTPADGSKRRVYEVIARSIAKIARSNGAASEICESAPQREQPGSDADVGGTNGESGNWPV
jgi:single-strand DNA-binding protein